jgi:hypothetical protein
MNMPHESFLDTSVNSFQHLDESRKRLEGCVNDCCQKVAEELKSLKLEVEEIRRFLSASNGRLVS